ncbi:hypothetical protein F2Q68_00003962 [Brassica cretica]|uniref:Uncharacterized protein n=1 Tax=Brassica cretica TaxID=69181 RepID=A0A8S9J7W1_BRACR|nr:hypothetical protein F2Q68_00003962 [Brassica cretica]
MSVMKPVVKMYARTTSYGKTAVNTATATRTASSSATRKIPEVKSVSQRPFIHVCHHCGVVGHIRPKGTSKSGAKEACQEVRRDVRQGVRQEVIQRVAVSNKPEIVHQCTNMKVRQKVLKHSCAFGTRKETDRCISNCVRPKKKQHQIVECFAREKSRNMAKKANKMFIKPKRVEKVFLAKSGLLDEIKDKTSEEGCSSGRSDLEVDQEASSLEPEHRVICGTEGKEIELHEEELMVNNTTHEGNKVISRSWSKGSSTCASDRAAGLVIYSAVRENGDVPPRNAYLMGEKSMVWCTSRGGEKHIWCGSFKVRNVVIELEECCA